ncbi:response regulator [Niveispirillum sp. BGYR6]|uniref:Hpt domain-containing response regulator n=1 Tax=Niveispirillum sp. BGYR6 TaxID=2971249 RepID=UPI0022B9CAC9|nr:response regulator [Niveispirillum sp. BGYR6]MDG5495671.1 response regulator [Niveispirillum sp. BGYR6]
MAVLPTLSPAPVKIPHVIAWTGLVWLAMMLLADLLLLGPTAGILLCRLPVLVCLLGWLTGRPAGWPMAGLTALAALAGQSIAVALWAGVAAPGVMLAAGALALGLPAGLLGRTFRSDDVFSTDSGPDADSVADIRAAESVPKPVLRIAGDSIQAHLAVLGDGLDRLAYGADGARIRPLCAEVKQIRIAVEQTLGAPPQQPARPLRAPPDVNAAASPAPPATAPIRRPLSILLVDDDVVGRTLTRLLLEKDGHEVEETDDAKMALEMALMEGPELALVSARIGRHRGLALAWCIQRGKGPPVILLRGPADRAMEADIQRAGLRGVLDKPVTPAGLEAVLDAVLDAFLASNGPAETTSAGGGEELNQELLADHLRLLGPERLGQIIDSFLSNAPETLENAAKAAREGDVHNLGRAAHKLASGALTVGAATLAALAKGIDTAAKRNEGEAALSQARQLPTQWLEAKAALTRFRQGL